MQDRIEGFEEKTEFESNELRMEKTQFKFQGDGGEWGWGLEGWDGGCRETSGEFPGYFIV